MAHKHSVYDTDAHLRIVPALRKIIGAENIKLVRGDHNSTRVTFEIPRYVDGHDMAETSIVEIHFINISSDVQNTNMDVYIASDVQLSPDSDDVVIFSWLISNNATKYDGTLSFMLCFKCLTGESLDYAWRTDTVTGVYVLESLDCVAADFEDITDILTAWEMKISGIEDKIQSVEGAIDGKLDKVTETHWGPRLYGVNADGTQVLYGLSWGAGADAVAIRTTGGALSVGQPLGDTHAVPLGFADGRYVPLITGTGGNRLYGVNPQGKQVEFGAAFTNYPFTLPMRDEHYTFTVGEPTDPMHPTTKQFVENGFVPKISPFTNGAWGVYTCTADGSTTLMMATYATNGTIPMRGTGGTLIVGEPQADNHATTRKFVVDKCGWQSGYVAGANEYIATISTDFSGFIDVPTATAENVYIPMLGRDSIELLVTVKDADGELHSEYVEIYDLGEGQLMGYSMGRFGLASTEDASGDLYINVIASR